MNMMKKCILTLMLFVVVIVSGCRSSAPVYHIREDIDFSYFKKVAVMPLDNLTPERAAADIVRQIVTSELLASGLVDVIVPGEVMTALNDLDIKNISSLNEKQIQAIGKSLQVEGLIIGAVEKYGETRIGNVSAPEATITLMMADTGSGNIVWSMTGTRGGADFMARHFGAKSETMSETVMVLIRGMVQTLKRQ
ncbi:MAG: hypothetical protein C4538_12140 [Nitrospiraceae bacterium]|nr:MAG: hypothetical protein C4538_12140 [Nitrospiraceae bacterium]